MVEPSCLATDGSLPPELPTLHGIGVLVTFMWTFFWAASFSPLIFIADLLEPCLPWRCPGGGGTACSETMDRSPESGCNSKTLSEHQEIIIN